MRAIDCQGFAGGMTLGVVQSGFELVSKHEEEKGFGMPLCEGNRHLLGESWFAECKAPWEWTPTRGVQLVFGNPPCSGFSTLNVAKTRGIDAPINQCMRNFASFAHKCKPTMAIMESVQQAYTTGRPLMQILRDIVGTEYRLIHVLHSCAAVGGCQIRRRYFMVLSTIPFGIEEPEIKQLITVSDVYRDLVDRELNWEGTPDSHQIHDTPSAKRCIALMNGYPWPQGWPLAFVLTKAFDEGHDIEQYGFDRSTVISQILRARVTGGHAIFRQHEKKQVPVIDGGALGKQLNPWVNRPITHREAARAMGFPDDWTCIPARDNPGGFAWYGKGVTVQCGRWIGGWARRALEGNPGSVVGEEIGENEFYINVSNHFTKPPLPEGDRFMSIREEAGI